VIALASTVLCLDSARAVPPWTEVEIQTNAATTSEQRTETLEDRYALGPEGLPKVLSDDDAELYREIFRLQERGNWKAADKRIAKLDDRMLMGHVQFQRYMHPTAYRSRYKELKRWLDRYADHPGAKRIYDLAIKRRPKNHLWPRKPVRHRSPYIQRPAAAASATVPSKPLSRAKRKRAQQIKWQVKRYALHTRLTAAEQLLTTREAKRLLHPAEIDDGRAQVAAAWYYYGKLPKAYDLARSAAERSGEHVPLAHWIAGLAAWRLNDLPAAAAHFEQLALSGNASKWNSAAGAYWAARSHLRLRRPEEMSRWLALAADAPMTFYGLLARRALGMETRFDFRPHRLTPAGAEILLGTPESRRALALMQAGQHRRAEQELLRLRNWNVPEGVEALLSVAERARLPSLSFKLASRLVQSGHAQPQGDKLEAALFPIPPWQPEGGFKVDRALIYALMRQESAFNPRAKSRDGARGLMQLLPSTAGFVARNYRRFRGHKRNELFEPSLNMDLGQRYVTHLLSNEQVGGDLFRVTTAYNGGPGNLMKWERRMKFDDDPLLFIESLPARETRLFIERVLTNFWIYRARLGQPAPSLDATAAGDWPGYAALDGASQEIAYREQDRRQQGLPAGPDRATHDFR
jgi:soluble lytic murein transglycosylase-like protein